MITNSTVSAHILKSFHICMGRMFLVGTNLLLSYKRLSNVILLVILMILGRSTIQAQCLTADGREALFEELLQKSKDREAWSPHKPINGYEAFEKAAQPLREQFREADTDQKLARAIYLLSNLRQDAHLSIKKVNGGLNFQRGVAYAPIRFAPDFSKPLHHFFVSDTAKESPLSSSVEVTDRLLAVNGISIEVYVSELQPFVIHSTENNLRWKLARYLAAQHLLVEPSLYTGDSVTYTLQKSNGLSYNVTAPYLVGKKIEWQGIGQPAYNGFHKVMQRQNFRLHLSDGKPDIVLIDWRDLEGRLKSDLRALMRYAKRNDLQDKDVIFYAPFSSGGRGSPRVVRRLTGRRFKTTYGNLRISDLTVKYADYRKGKIKKWVDRAVREGWDYTSNEPFKLRYFKAGSDGIMKPAGRHFRGKVVGVFSSLGGSNLDQLAAMVIDNQLMPTIGYPTGGYSNTWELSEIIKCPDSGQKLLRYYWTVGHTIRPNGEILEGNPAAPDELMLLTRQNYPVYWESLIQRAVMLLKSDP